MNSDKDDKEKLLVEIEKLKREKKSLHKIISHDIKSPFNRVFSLIHLMQMSEDNLSEEQHDYLDTMYLAIISGIDMIKNMNSLREIEQGNLKIDVEVLEFRVLMEKLHRDFSQISEMKHINLDMEGVLNAQIKIEADSYFAERSIYQIVTNALKYCQKGDNITLQLGIEGSWLVFSCVDSGPGLKLEEQKSIYSKFYKCSNTPTGGEGQTGLGLYLTKIYQEEMNGKVEFLSGEGKGSTVKLYYPLKK